jgi:hypothetical protein
MDCGAADDPFPLGAVSGQAPEAASRVSQQRYDSHDTVPGIVDSEQFYGGWSNTMSHQSSSVLYRLSIYRHAL